MLTTFRVYCDEEDLDFKFTATIELADHAGCKQRAAMGCEGTWGTALDQWIAVIKNGI